MSVSKLLGTDMQQREAASRHLLHAGGANFKRPH